ncbi:DUF4190 domain-containing protein [Streptomyces sp. H39-S7]|uniref:DUF4190 domain-containing protein n=1 Tax=Streptomyces sp. H39-S7 TaxID=3004357 RepID=UPI0022AE6DD1|nr:DUF4190 domain-containing protein [Streptomyces sp. H39-S7]MCZ4121891.1 DUF4190 domain-containing protein [Streptomyces sp. H39-S7]
MAATHDSRTAAAYGQPAGGPARNGFGIAALVLGILSVLMFWLWFAAIPMAVIAIVLGILGRRRANRGEATNKGMATAGTVLGAVSIVLLAVLMAAGVAILNSDSGKDLQSCLDKAQTQSQKQQCQQDFSDDLSN